LIGPSFASFDQPDTKPPLQVREPAADAVRRSGQFGGALVGCESGAWGTMSRLIWSS